MVVSFVVLDLLVGPRVVCCGCGLWLSVVVVCCGCVCCGCVLWLCAVDVSFWLCVVAVFMIECL